MLRHGVGRGLATGWKTHHRTIITTTNSRRRLVEAPPPAFVQPKARNNIVQEVSPLPCRNVAVGRTTMQTRATTPHLFLFRRKFHSSSIVPNPWWARRFIKKRRKKRQEQKEKRNTNNHKHIIDGKPPLSPKNNNQIQKSWNERTHASNGRLVMTKQRMEEQLSSSGVLTKLVGPDGLLAKQVLHNIKAKMLFQQRIEHSHYDGMYFCNSYAIVDKSLLSSLPSAVTIVVDGEQEKEGDGMVELRATGMARRKKLGETFATVDLLLFLQECGVDLQNPPDQRAMRALEKTKQFQQELKQAQLLLELCRVSKPNFDTTTNNTNSTSTVTMLSHGTLITGEATANSKKEAENKALIQAAKNLDPDKIQQFQTFLEKSPAGHVAPLHISPLPEDSLKELQDAIGSLEDHNERMNRFAEIKEEFEQRYIARGGGARPNRGNPRNNSNDVNPSNHSERINAIFFQEEHRRKQKALEDKPNGKHAQMMSVRDALPIVQIKHTLLEALQTDPVLVVSGGTGSGYVLLLYIYIYAFALVGHLYFFSLNHSFMYLYDVLFYLF